MSKRGLRKPLSVLVKRLAGRSASAVDWQLVYECELFEMLRGSRGVVMGRGLDAMLDCLVERFGAALSVVELVGVADRCGGELALGGVVPFDLVGV